MLFGICGDSDFEWRDRDKPLDQLRSSSVTVRMRSVWLTGLFVSSQCNDVADANIPVASSNGVNFRFRRIDAGQVSGKSEFGFL